VAPGVSSTGVIDVSGTGKGLTNPSPGACTTACTNSGDPPQADPVATLALISDHFYYLGAIVPQLARRHLEHPIEKRGPRHRSHFSEEFVAGFVELLEGRYIVGMHGLPCAGHPDSEGFEEIRPRKKCRPWLPTGC
jgi:hypothetical protein